MLHIAGGIILAVIILLLLPQIIALSLILLAGGIAAAVSFFTSISFGLDEGWSAVIAIIAMAWTMQATYKLITKEF